MNEMQYTPIPNVQAWMLAVQPVMYNSGQKKVPIPFQNYERNTLYSREFKIAVNVISTADAKITWLAAVTCLYSMRFTF